MKRLLTIVWVFCAVMVADALGQPLLKTHVETGNVEGVLEGSFAPWSDNPRSFGMDASQKGAEAQGLAFQKHLNKKNLKQLRKMDAMSLCDGNVGFAGFWPMFDADKPTTMQFSNGASLIMRPNRKQIDFIDRFFRAKRQETEAQRR